MSKHTYKTGDSEHRQWYRHCVHCGWGFSFHAWKGASFCPRCGKRVKNPKDNAPEIFDAETGVPVRAEAASPGVLSKAKTTVQTVVAWLRSHPFLGGALLVAAGTGLVLSGAALTVASAALASLGASIISATSVAGMLVIFLGILGEDVRGVMGGGAILMAGAVIGGVIAFVGAVIGAAAAVLTGLGWIVLAAGLLLAILRAGAAVYERRAEIMALVKRMREGVKSLSADSSADRAKVDDLLQTIEREMARRDGDARK